MSRSNEVTIYDIAKAVNLSASTISRALSGSRFVNQETRSRIKQVASELGYRPNFFARRLRSEKSFLIGAMVTRMNNSVASSVLSGAESAAGQLGYGMLLSQSMNHDELRARSIQQFRNHSVDAILVTSAYFQEYAALDQFRKLRVPVVIVEESAMLPGCPKKQVTDFQNAFELTNHLLEKGCRRIAHVSLNVDSARYAELIAGSRAALRESKRREADKFVLTNGLDGSWSAIREIFLSLSPWPDGIIFSNNTITAVAGAPSANAATRGRQFWLTCRKGSLSSQSQILFELGEIAAALLVGLADAANCSHMKHADVSLG